MEAGHGGQVHEPRLREPPLAQAVQSVPLPGEHGQEKAPLRLPIDLPGGPPQSPGHPLGQVPESSAGLRLQLAPAVQAQKDAPGGEIGALLSAQNLGALIFHIGGGPVPRLQIQQLPAAVVHRPAQKALDPDLTAGAEVRLLRVPGQLHHRSPLRARQLPGGSLDQGGVAGEPEKPRRQPGGPDAHPRRWGQPHQQSGQRRPQPPGLRQQVAAQGASGGEGQGKHRQSPHGGYLVGSIRSVRPRM